MEKLLGTPSSEKGPSKSDEERKRGAFYEGYGDILSNYITFLKEDIKESYDQINGRLSGIEENIEKCSNSLEEYTSIVSFKHSPWIDENKDRNEEYKIRRILHPLHSNTTHYLHIPSFKEPMYDKQDSDSGIGMKYDNERKSYLHKNSGWGHFIFPFSPKCSGSPIKKMKAIFLINKNKFSIKFYVISTKWLIAIWAITIIGFIIAIISLGIV